MKNVTNSTFNEGLLMDLNPLVTPQTCLSDCLNGTLITYNGNEFTLQNDMGNVKIPDSELPEGYIPLGIKEYGGIIYTALYNPKDNRCEIGSIPSPNYNVNPSVAGDGIIELSSSGHIQGSSSAGYEFKQLFLKLFEPEQLLLNPGDEYVLGYKVVSGADVLSGQPLYNVELYAIDRDNQQYLLDDTNVIKLVNPEPVSKDYKYFNHTISSVLALKINIKNIDFFDAVVYEVKEGVLFNFYGRNKLNKSHPEDDLYIKGCRLNYTHKGKTEQIFIGPGERESTFNHTFLLDKTTASLENDEIVDFEITPFDQYHPIDELTRKLSIRMGQPYIPGAVDNIYKYKYNKSNKILRLDFDRKTLGMVDPYVYIEFYDIWSDFSVIYPIEDINQAGVNTAFLDTIIEKVENVYSPTNRGGTSNNVLLEYNPDKDKSSKIYKPLISNIIRKDRVLREDNMYVVRIASIDMDGKDPETLKLSDYENEYKLLIVNSNYNNYYDQITESGITKDVDFNSLNLNNEFQLLSDVTLRRDKEDLKIEENDTLSLITEVGNDYFYYKVLETSDPIPSGAESAIDNLTLECEDKVDIKIDKIINGFGLSTIKNYNVNVVNSKIEVTDQDQSVGSSYSVTSADGTLKHSLKTFRETSAYITTEVKDVTIETARPTIADSIMCYNSNVQNYGFYLRGKRNGQGSNYDIPCFFLKRTGGSTEQPTGNTLQVSPNTDTEALTNLFSIYNTSGAILSIHGRINSSNPDAWAGSKTDTVNLKDKYKGETLHYQTKWFPVFRTADGKSCGITYKNQAKAAEILKDLCYPLYDSKKFRLCYYTSPKTDETSSTRATGTNTIQVDTELEITQNINKQSFKSTSTVITKLKELMTARGITDYNIVKTDYFKMEGISASDEKELQIKDMEIRIGADSETRSKVVNSREDLLSNNPTISNPQEIKTKVISNSGNFINFTHKFKAEIVNNKVVFSYIPDSLCTSTVWAESTGNSKYRAFDVDLKQLDAE